MLNSVLEKNLQVDKVMIYCEKENQTIKNLNRIEENNLIDKNERLYIEESKLFSFFSNYKISEDENLLGKNLIMVSSGKIGRIPLVYSIQNVLNFNILCLNIPGLNWVEPYVRDCIYCNSEDCSDKNLEEILKLLKEYSEKNNIKFDGIFTYDDYCVLVCSRIAKALELRSLDYDVAFNIKNKFQLRKQIQEKQIFDDIKFISINQNCMEKILNGKINYKDLQLDDGKEYIIKDTLGSGKSFVRKFNNFEMLIKIILSIYEDDNLKICDYLIEEYYDGLEIDIDIIIQDSKIKFISTSDNFKTDEEHFIELGGCTPSRYLNSDEFEYIKTVSQKMIEKLNIDCCCLHFEAKCRPKSLYGEYEKDMPFFPIEINLRIGGAEVFSFHAAVYNYNLFYNLIKVACGIQILDYVPQREKNVFCASVNFQAKNSGYIKEISFDKELFKDDSLECIILFCKTGDYIDLEKKKGNGYLGWMVVNSKISVVDSINNLKNIIEKVKIKIVK